MLVPSALVGGLALEERRRGVAIALELLLSQGLVETKVNPGPMLIGMRMTKSFSDWKTFGLSEKASSMMSRLLSM